MSVVRDALLPGERLLWEGRPYTGLLLRPIEVFLIPFSLLWGGFAIFWNASVWTSLAPIEFRLFGIPFLVAGAYLIVGRFLVDILLRRRLAYAVTDRLILIVRAGGSIKALDIACLPVLQLQERAGGSGTLRFGPDANWFLGNDFGIWQPTFERTPQFLGIPDARSVYALIQQQRR